MKNNQTDKSKKNGKEVLMTLFYDKVKPFFLNNNKRNLKITAIVVAVVFLFAAIHLGVRINSLLQQVSPDDGIDFQNKNETWVEETDNFDFDSMHDITNAASLNDLLYKWANNGGEKMYGKNIINVMLFGTDNYSKPGHNDPARSGSRSDTMMLVSLNKTTKKINIVSIMRDSYTYMNIDGQKRFFKINAAYGWGGPGTVVKIIEDNYKIAIDKYVCVDFDTFPDIIDMLGGVTVEVLPHEARYMNRGYGFSISPGEAVVLNGEEALVFSRIRALDADGDVSRTRRQRAVIMAIIKKAQEASASDFNATLDVIFPNIRTNYSKSEILKLGTQALAQGWADYEIVQVTSPAEENRSSATINTHWVWVVDYPAEAHGIQMMLYGTSNIDLEPGRVNPSKYLIPRKPVTTTTTEPEVIDTNDSNKNDETSNSETKKPTIPFIDIIPTIPAKTEATDPAETQAGDTVPDIED